MDIKAVDRAYKIITLYPGTENSNDELNAQYRAWITGEATLEKNIAMRIIFEETCGASLGDTIQEKIEAIMPILQEEGIKAN